MSSKKKTTTTKEEATPVLVPKLRFPEFRGAKGWENKLIGPYLEDCTGRVPPDTELPVYSSTREGLKRQDAYFDGRVLQNKNDYGVVPPGCLVYRHMSDDGLFKFNINETGGEIAVSKEYPVFSTKDLNSVFLLAKLNDGLDFKHFALSKKAGGTRTRLYFSRLCEWRTLLPLPAEQQKIAECLSSVDELMAAQARKVDALKTHKKGLMQQLFPREGETQPRLRFPEFQNAGDWNEDALGNVCTVLNSRRRPITSSNRKPGPYRYYGASGVVDYVDDYIFDERVVLVGEDGAKWGAFEKTAFIVEGRFWVNNHAHVLKPNGVNDALLENYLTMADLSPFITGAAPPKLTLGKLKEIPVPIPPDEKEGNAIAKCLSSLDALITAETQTFEALKAHKKGLMQQLFPSPQEVVEA